MESELSRLISSDIDLSGPFGLDSRGRSNGVNPDHRH